MVEYERIEDVAPAELEDYKKSVRRKRYEHSHNMVERFNRKI